MVGPSSSDGSTVASMVLSLAKPNNLVLAMSSLIGTTLATRRIQNLEPYTTMCYIHYFNFWVI